MYGTWTDVPRFCWRFCDVSCSWQDQGAFAYKFLSTFPTTILHYPKRVLLISDTICPFEVWKVIIVRVSNMGMFNFNCDDLEINHIIHLWANEHLKRVHGSLLLYPSFLLPFRAFDIDCYDIIVTSREKRTYEAICLVRKMSRFIITFLFILLIHICNN